MKKRTKIILWVLLGLIVIAHVVGYIILAPIAAVGNGFAAKVLCSSVFVSGRDYQSVMAEDLDLTADYMIKTKLDEANKAASASILGIFTTRAVFRPGLGCTLEVDGANEVELRQQALGLPAPPARNREALWPEGEAVAETLPAGVDGEKLKAALDKAFQDNEKKTIRTRAVVVIYDGALVAERYAPGFTKDTPLLGWSMTKSLTNALVGVLVRQGKLDVDAPAPVPDWQGDSRQKITLDQLMRMSSGLKFIEEYTDNITSDCNVMLFTRRSASEYAAGRPLEAEPGSKWSYSSGTTNIIARIARQAGGLGTQDWFLFPRKELFDRIGMTGMIMEPDPSGDFVGSSFSYAPARDWARFGLLYLRDGVWNGERILPEGWVAYSTRPTAHTPPGEAYGAQWWLNDPNPESWLPFLPPDMYSAWGFEGQHVMVIPSRKTVVVRLGLTRGSSEKEYLAFVQDVLEALPAE